VNSPSKTFLNCPEMFLSVVEQFRLGHLTTETPHPLTRDLSSLAKTNLKKGVEILKEVDREMLNILSQKSSCLKDLWEAVEETRERNGRIFLVGCGATGRLSLALETLWRQENPKSDQLVSFMAGGDIALISSIEKFEDYPEYGARQLKDLKFGKNDLLIACTEGGETPFVIGATEEAARISKFPPFFLYCNPDQELTKIQRSQDVLSNPQIKKVNLTTGPMALAGSTRMQASTILMAFVGISLWASDYSDIDKRLVDLRELFDATDPTFLIPFIEKESDHYEKGGHILYQCSQQLGITVLTDTTERSPTFSLWPFEPVQAAKQVASLCYLYFSDSPNAETAWEQLLGRAPRTLEWQELEGIANTKQLLKYDFGKDLIVRRSQLLEKEAAIFVVKEEESGVFFQIGESQFIHDYGQDLLSKHLMLKMHLNLLSTLIMGRMNRYEGNIMTWVRPSNLKLIDRTIRYAQILLERKELQFDYEFLVRRLFEIKNSVSKDQSLVLALVSACSKKD
jgi:N-acetylmuramic acid 6-phosphate etherase